MFGYLGSYSVSGFSSPLFGRSRIVDYSELLNLKPDITVEERTRVSSLDISCQCDVYISEAHELKLEKKSLQAFIEREVMPCICHATISRSLGTVHKYILEVIIDTGMPQTKANDLVKWCSTSDIGSSRQIRNVRCRLV